MRSGAFIVAMFGLMNCAIAADISVTGSWSEQIDNTYLMAGAGSNLQTTIESDVAQATIDITNTLPDTEWTVKVRKSDFNWPSGVSLSVQLTDIGSGTGTIYGGSYLNITSTDQIFFSGLGDRYDMKIRLRTSGQTITNSPPDSYTTSVTYTIE